MGKGFDPATVKAPIWGIQACDTSKSFDAFSIYRDLGKDRTLDKVAVKIGQGGGTVVKWYYAHGWKERVLAYDSYLDQIHLAEAEAAFRMRVKEEAQRTQELIFKAKRLVEHDVDVLVRRAEFQAAQGGDVDNATVLDRGNMVKLLDKVTVLERLTTGASTENLTVDDKSKPRTIKHIFVGAPEKGEQSD
jgi:hypothetical protein